LARVDLHVHSSASFDCKVPPHLVAERLRSYGISPVLLTDHDTMNGVRELRRAGEAEVIGGQEIMTQEGELIGLFLEQPVEQGLTPEETVELIKSQGALVYLQHPLDGHRRSLTLAAIERLRHDIDIVEIFNGRSGHESNRGAEDLCYALGAVAGAGSDAHALEEIGKVYVELEDFVGPVDFLEKLEAARIVVGPHKWRTRLFQRAGGILARIR
jgi:predicted metal-dependent phosphoesterase TrpH